MLRTQIQLTPQQVRWLKQKAAEENISMAEVIRQSLDAVREHNEIISPEKVRQKALQAVGALAGPRDLAENHDRYLTDTYPL